AVNAGSTIVFNTAKASSLIVLSQGELRLSQNMTITGPGAGALTITGTSATGASRVFETNAGVTVSISGLTISGGNASPFFVPFGTSNTPGNQGGDLFNGGNLTLTDDVVQNGLAQGDGTDALGGGIFNAQGATLTLSGTTVTGNTAQTTSGLN